MGFLPSAAPDARQRCDDFQGNGVPWQASTPSRRSDAGSQSAQVITM
jgi:hypothetical protein